MKKSVISSLAFGTVLAALLAAPALAVDPVPVQDYTELANQHCAAFLSGSGASMGFALGKASAKFSTADMNAFNQNFARKLIADYSIDSSKGCVLDAASLQSVMPKNSKPNTHNRRDLPPAIKEMAVVNGMLASTKLETPVSISYRLERTGLRAWTITNISLNGQPMVDRYREEYEALANSGRAEAVLKNL